ncbi:MAG: hypothetical protein HZB51_02100 [Chloroflexi bacterium]|nr:hypothetical protein [Chloroflexota bacterium]
MSNQPVRKTQARMLERQRALKQVQRRDTITHSLPYGIAAAVVLFIGVVVFLVTNQSVSGIPRFQVDQEKIDLGNRIFNQPVRAVFNVKNVGDGTLKLETPRVAEVLEGC